ncbi:MAG: TIGR00270 family protein [Thermoplasmata archaeon]|nr:TIGR00270 family protein [Thermoplasmata archaeon]
MPCEMCGKEVPRLRKVQIGGSTLEVCNECARFGEDAPGPAPKAEPAASGPAAVAEPPPAPAFVHHGRKKDALSRGEMELADDFNRRIIVGRRKKDLTQEELARRINEKKSVISRLETGEMRPSDRLIKVLEKELDIKLMERMEYQVEPAKKRVASGGVTLGDLIKMEK